jgi:hypothetical protein
MPHPCRIAHSKNRKDHNNMPHEDFSPHHRGYKQMQGSPIFSGEAGFIITAVGVLLFFGMMLGALGATWLASTNGCGV